MGIGEVGIEVGFEGHWWGQDAKVRANVKRKKGALMTGGSIGRGLTALQEVGEGQRAAGQPLHHEEKLPWDQQHHLRQGNHGYQVHPAGGEVVSEFRDTHLRGTGQTLGVEKRRGGRGHLHARQGVQAGQQVQVHL
jgi:hypothetical protein